MLASYYIPISVLEGFVWCFGFLVFYQGGEVFALASLFQTGPDPSLYACRYCMKCSYDTNKQQMQFQIEVMPRHFEGKWQIQIGQTIWCFSKFKGPSRVLEKSWMCYQAGTLQEGRSHFDFFTPRSCLTMFAKQETGKRVRKTLVWNQQTHMLRFSISLSW